MEGREKAVKKRKERVEEKRTSEKGRSQGSKRREEVGSSGKANNRRGVKRAFCGL